jgi:uncharacterized membrane protein YozB (DUF420 family)
MDVKLLFWCWALANMGLVVACAVRGARAIRRNDVEAHRRAMSWAGRWVVVFLLAYLTKKALLGGEDLRTWSSFARTNLYVHETFVATMLLAGIAAFVLGGRLAKTRRVTKQATDPLAPAQLISRHRLGGRVAIVGALLGFLTACGILAGMLGRG